MSAGKGDTRRPSAVSREELERRWEKAFGKRLDIPFEMVRGKSPVAIALGEKAEKSPSAIPPHGLCKVRHPWWCHKKPGHDGACLLRNYPPFA